MKIEARIFLSVAAFAGISAVIYGVWTSVNTQTGIDNTVEWAGFAALLFSMFLFGLSGSFFWFVSRRIDPRPEDRSDAEIAEGAGELGFFSPHSYWPIAIAGAATVIAFGMALVQYWLVAAGVALVLFTVGGLLYEYYGGGRKALK